MPNWCLTNIHISNKEPKELERLNDLINSWKGENGWLGNIITNSSIGTVNSDKETDLPSRGEVVDNYVKDDILHIGMLSAYIPYMCIWEKIIEKYSPDSQMYYVGSEPLMMGYFSNKPEYKDCYHIETRCDDEYDNTNKKEAELIPILQKILNTDSSNIDVLINMLENSEYPMVIAKWDYTGE